MDDGDVGGEEGEEKEDGMENPPDLYEKRPRY